MRALFLRDLALAARAGGGLGLSLAFFLVFVALVPLGAGPQPAALARVAPGVLWLGALLACLLSLDRLLAVDWDDGALDLLATSPLPLEGIVAAKAAAHWATTGLPLALAAPVLGALLGLAPAGGGALALGLALGTPALSMIGAFGAALTVGVRRGGPLLPLLVLPLCVPTLVLGADAARRAAAGLDPATPLALLAGLTLAVLAAMPFAAGAVLRASLR